MTQVSYPGVYIEEVPSGYRTITSVSTSITAFAGRTLKGPTDRATRIGNYGVFEKQFGGLWRESPLSYSIRQFFQNGGTDAVIVRIIDQTGESSEITLANTEAEGIVLQQSTPGTGGNELRVEVTDDGADRHIELTEIARPPSGAEVIVRTADYTGADAAAIAAALAADDSIVSVSEDTEDFAVVPDVAGPFDFDVGTAAARAATGTLPVTIDNVEIQAVAVGEAGNDTAVTILHSQTDDQLYSVVVEQQQNDGNYNLLGTVESTTNAGVAAAAGIGIVVAVDPAGLASRPLETTRQHLADGTDILEASLNLPTEGLAFIAANEGEWGDQIQLHANRDTSDPADNNRFNLIVELLNDDGRAVVTETFLNVSIDADSPRFVSTIVEQSSLLVRTDGAMPAEAPAPTSEDGIMMAYGSNGGEVQAADFVGAGMQATKTGLYQLEDVDLFNLLVIPPLTRAIDVPDPLWTDALAYCIARRAVLIIDPPSAWNRPDQAILGIPGMAALRSPNSVIYFPRVRAADPLRDNMLDTFAPSGIMAGLMSRTDAQRGVWKAPAGLEASLRGVRSLAYLLIDSEVGQLNPIGINCLQVRPAAGPVAWGSRTLQGDDRLASEWKYVPVRRIALLIEESLYRGTQFAVFEPNDNPLWQQLRLAAGTFMNNLFRRGAFQGSSPDEAYFVKCDGETTIQADIDLGIVNLEVGFAPLKPAEFVVIRIRQMAGQADS